MKFLGITLEGQTAVAELFENLAPTTCNAFWSRLPLDLPAFHSKVCEFELMVPTPVLCDFGTENFGMPKDGDIAYHPMRSSINIFYDKIRPLAPVSIMGKISQNNVGFREEALKLWKKQGSKIRFFRYDEAALSSH